MEPEPRERSLSADLPELFGQRESLVYYHAHKVSSRDLDKAVEACPLFEIDLAWAHSAFEEKVVIGSPFIGHPEEFYTILGNEFPSDNVTLAEFQEFLQKYPSIKVLIDIKDDSTYKNSSFLEDLVNSVGNERCIVHAFMSNWTLQPNNQEPEPHVYREDVDLATLDKVLSTLGVPLIANSRGFNNEHVEANQIVDRMITDAKQCGSIVSLGIYFPSGSHMPHYTSLQTINDAGYWAWVNGNNCALDNKSCCSNKSSRSNSIVKNHSTDFQYVFEAYAEQVEKEEQEEKEINESSSENLKPVQSEGSCASFESFDCTEKEISTEIDLDLNLCTEIVNIDLDFCTEVMITSELTCSDCDSSIVTKLKEVKLEKEVKENSSCSTKRGKREGTGSNLKKVKKDIWNTLRLITMSDEMSACTRLI